MTPRRCFYYFRAWLKNLWSVKALSAFLSSFGALWLVVEASTFFLSDTKWPNDIRNFWWLFGSAGIGIAVWICKPRLSVSYNLNGRDVTMEIAVGDILALPGALIIGSNTTFDTRISRELISKNSVQGMFTKEYYSDEKQLDREIDAALTGTPSEDLTGSRLGKARRFPIGTCVRLNPKSRTAYLVAIANINEHGVASGTFDDLQDSLSKLWVFIGQRGLKESLLIPALGTGFSRLGQPREEVVREIIKSFVAACVDKTFADRLTIVISPYDVAIFNISLDDLGAFLKHVCQYTSFSTGSRKAIGTPV